MKTHFISATCIAAASFVLAGCNDNDNFISRETADKVAAEIISSNPQADPLLVARGVAQAAGLWTEEDGTKEEFEEFLPRSFEGTPEGKRELFEKLSKAYETFFQSQNQLSTELGRPTILNYGNSPAEIDYILGSYSPGAHFADDMFANKVAFITMLNFPYYSLEEKDSLGMGWSRLEWAYARMGDMFTDRVPASVQQDIAEASAQANSYVDDYNIMMRHVLDSNGEKLFPEGMSLLSHWNLRDEIKANYAGGPTASRKQEVIYKVLDRIATQTIPAAVVNCPDYDWDPFANKVYKDGVEVTAEEEGTVRYQQMLNQYHALRRMDPYCPSMSDAITRNFCGDLEIPADKVEELFIEVISSPQMKEVAGIVKNRLGRELRPYDIWYDGFKSRSAFPEDELSAKTRRLYPDEEAFHKDMPRLLANLGFAADEASYIADRIVVEPARGSGHAAGCYGRGEPARLRTRIGSDGMDYKGYNIAVHEFGHNVEMVIDMYHIDHYMLFGVPNNAFTEAMAFLFQMRDLQLLGYGEQKFDDNAALDTFWGMYEIMGVGLVDMHTWRWLYAHPEATARQLRDYVLAESENIWNRYFEPVLGSHGSHILAVYSHMIAYPMYLPSYSLGDIIHCQLEKHLSSCASKEEFAAELQRIYRLGRLTPEVWMKQAVGSPISIAPMLEEISRVKCK